MFMSEENIYADHYESVYMLCCVVVSCYFLIILEKNGKNMEINLASASLMISEQEIYQYCLKKWKIAQK